MKTLGNFKNSLIKLFRPKTSKVNHASRLSLNISKAEHVLKLKKMISLTLLNLSALHLNFSRMKFKNSEIKI